MNFPKFLRTPFLHNTSGRLLLSFLTVIIYWKDFPQIIISGWQFSAKDFLEKIFTVAGYSFHVRNMNAAGFTVKPHTSDIRITYEYIRVTYGLHTNTYE